MQTRLECWSSSNHQSWIVRVRAGPPCPLWGIEGLQWDLSGSNMTTVSRKYMSMCACLCNASVTPLRIWQVRIAAYLWQAVLTFISISWYQEQEQKIISWYQETGINIKTACHKNVATRKPNTQRCDWGISGFVIACRFNIIQNWLLNWIVWYRIKYWPGNL